MKFKKKPVVIDAIQWTGNNICDVYEFIAKLNPNQEFTLTAMKKIVIGRDVLKIKEEIITLEGDMVANKGDWIICGDNGEFYPCKPDIFEQTYEAVS